MVPPAIHWATEAIIPLKRQRDPSEDRDSSGEQGDEDQPRDDDKQRGDKPGRIDDSELPWYNQELTAKDTENPAITENRRLLRLYGKNISSVKQKVLHAATAPAGILSSEIENALRGQSINLDVIFSALHHVRPPKENVGRVGHTEIRFEASQPSRWVSTSREWAAAWNRARLLLTFLFPQRADKTAKYGEYINHLFTAQVTTSHHRIILYNQSVRNFVQGSQRHLLTDMAAFNDIFIATIFTSGVEFGASIQSTKKKEGGGGNATAICRRFNWGNCPHSTEKCTY